MIKLSEKLQDKEWVLEELKNYLESYEYDLEQVEQDKQNYIAYLDQQREEIKDCIETISDLDIPERVQGFASVAITALGELHNTRLESANSDQIDKVDARITKYKEKIKSVESAIAYTENEDKRRRGGRS